MYKMNYSGLLKFNRKWETAVANNQNHFKFTSKAGKKYIVRYQQGYFNVYNMKNDIIADHITTVNDMVNCATMITNTK